MCPGVRQEKTNFRVKVRCWFNVKIMRTELQRPSLMWVTWKYLFLHFWCTLYLFHKDLPTYIPKAPQTWMLPLGMEGCHLGMCEEKPAWPPDSKYSQVFICTYPALYYLSCVYWVDWFNNIIPCSFNENQMPSVMIMQLRGGTVPGKT